MHATFLGIESISKILGEILRRGFECTSVLIFILLLRLNYSYLSMILDLVLDVLKTYLPILMGVIYLYGY